MAPTHIAVILTTQLAHEPEVLCIRLSSSHSLSHFYNGSRRRSACSWRKGISFLLAQNASLKLVKLGTSDGILFGPMLLAALTFVGCASPGPPRAPSLQLPQPVQNLTATRNGDTVAVRFTLPERTTDNLAIRDGAVQASLCFGLEGSPCTPVPTRRNISLKLFPAAGRSIQWTEVLPPADTTGEPTLLAFRVRLSNMAGKSAGWSQPAYTASGAAPRPVEDLRAAETPSGILLSWQPGRPEGDVLLERESLAPVNKQSRQNEPLWLLAHAEASGPHPDQTLDSSALEDVPYRYTAVRRHIVQLGDQKIELRSAVSSPAEIIWRDLSPPPAPTGLSAATLIENGGFAVDLVWNPVEQPGLQGYIVTRELDGVRQQLTPQPILLPAFHDAAAQPSVRYEYEVQAVSHKGVHSPSAVVIVQPTSP